jgi:hypothetical protein
VATSDSIAEIIGDYRAFAAMQHDRLLARGIDIAPYALSHLAVRVADWDLYVHQRTLLERHASANSENVWNGRPISKVVRAEGAPGRIRIELREIGLELQLGAAFPSSSGPVCPVSRTIRGSANRKVMPPARIELAHAV